MPTIRPYGTWPSPITPQTLATGQGALDEVRVDGRDTYWLAGRPSEGGRTALVRHDVFFAIAHAVQHVFVWAAPAGLVIFVLAWFIKEVPLRTASGGRTRPRRPERPRQASPPWQRRPASPRRASQRARWQTQRSTATRRGRQ